jgi:hypothetical protein
MRSTALSGVCAGRSPRSPRSKINGKMDHRATIRVEVNRAYNAGTSPLVLRASISLLLALVIISTLNRLGRDSDCLGKQGNEREIGSAVITRVNCQSHAAIIIERHLGELDSCLQLCSVNFGRAMAAL